MKGYESFLFFMNRNFLSSNATDGSKLEISILEPVFSVITENGRNSRNCSQVCTCTRLYEAKVQEAPEEKGFEGSGTFWRWTKSGNVDNNNNI